MKFIRNICGFVFALLREHPVKTTWYSLCVIGWTIIFLNVMSPTASMVEKLLVLTGVNLTLLWLGASAIDAERKIKMFDDRISDLELRAVHDPDHEVLIGSARLTSDELYEKLQAGMSEASIKAPGSKDRDKCGLELQSVMSSG